ncbi:hypothetical protein B0H10DRAFT_2058391 [Mycena sp. CBHHK59/15]|nr:hypothetical protein B0H10DRAFT_2058391 [Mycena sp. CBHHK59/15]
MDALQAQVKAIFSLFYPTATAPQGFCWQLLFPSDHDYILDMSETPFVPVSTIKQASGFQTICRLSFELREDYIHIFKDPNGKFARELVDSLPDGMMVGGQNLSNPSRTALLQIPSTLWLERAAYDTYRDMCLRAAVKNNPFRTWDEVDNFQAWSRGWCFLRLVSQDPQEASKIMVSSSKTMSWSSIFTLAAGKGNDELRFVVTSSESTSHITYHLNGKHTIASYKALLGPKVARKRSVSGIDSPWALV